MLFFIRMVMFILMFMTVYYIVRRALSALASLRNNFMYDGSPRDSQTRRYPPGEIIDITAEVVSDKPPDQKTDK